MVRKVLNGEKEETGTKQRGKGMTEFYKVNENKNPHFESLNNSSCANGIREHSGEERGKDRSPFNN